MDPKNQVERMKEIFESVLEKDVVFEKSLQEINYYNLMCKAAANDTMFKLFGSNFCVFNYVFEECESVLMVFAIPINEAETKGSKHVAERVMEVARKVEEAFITVDYMTSVEVKEDKFVYMTIIKKLEKSEIID